MLKKKYFQKYFTVLTKLHWLEIMYKNKLNHYSNV